jgi:hypothetical protein
MLWAYLHLTIYSFIPLPPIMFVLRLKRKCLFPFSRKSCENGLIFAKFHKILFCENLAKIFAPTKIFANTLKKFVNSAIFVNFVRKCLQKAKINFLENAKTKIFVSTLISSSLSISFPYVNHSPYFELPPQQLSLLYL